MATSNESPFPPLTEPPTPNHRVCRLYLCRHGETEPNAIQVLQGRGLDENLNERGIQQAEALRDRFSKVDLDVIVTSNLKRARQTASIVLQNHKNVPVLEFEDLAEIDWGIWEGKKNPELESLVASWEKGDFDAKSPGGESPAEVELRAIPIIYDLLRRPFKNYLIVVHGRLLRIILSSLIHKSLNKMSEFTHHNTCINVIDVVMDPNCPTSRSIDKQSDLTDGIMNNKVNANKDIGQSILISSNLQHEIRGKQGALPRIITDHLHQDGIEFIVKVIDDVGHLLPNLI